MDNKKAFSAPSFVSFCLILVEKSNTFLYDSNIEEDMCSFMDVPFV